MQHRTRNRAAFTLLEVMIAMALTLFVMVILSQAFVSSLDTFSGMKGIGDMQQALRTATVLLTDDLASDHFDGKRRLSDVDAAGNQLIVTQKPQAGFFAVKRGSAPSLVGPGYIFEGSDASGMPSYRAVDQMLYMTVKRKGNRQENYFTTPVSGAPNVLSAFFAPNIKMAYNVTTNPDLQLSSWTQQYNPVTNPTQGFFASQWAEVVWYLFPTGTTEEPTIPGGSGTPTFGLYRAQFVMVPDPNIAAMELNKVNWPLPNAAPLTTSTFAGLSCVPAGGSKLTFYSPADAALGQRMLPNFSTFTAAAANPIFDPRAKAVSTLVCPNVISFHVQVMPTDQTAAAWGVPPRTFIDIPAFSPTPTYDTTQFTPAGIAAGYPQGGLKGISVTLRVWDHGTRQTRQTTVMQDL